MVNPILVNMLVRKIQSGETNTKTGEVFKVEDILMQEYKDAVSAILNPQG